MPDLPHQPPATDLADPRLAPYRNVKDRDLERLRTGAQAGAAAEGTTPGLFLVEGELVVRQLIGSRFTIDSILLTPHRLEAMADLVASLPPGTPVHVVAQDLMNQIVGFDIHRGVLAAARRGPGLRARDLIAAAHTLIVLEDLSNHDNVGGIFRTVAGLAGVEGVGILLSPRTCDPLYRKSVRVSVGQALRVPFAVLEDWPAGLGDLTSAGFTLVATTPGPESVPLADLAPPPKLALLVGSEGPGLTAPALAHAAAKVRIPMHAGVDSLNVVVATGIVLAGLGGARA